MHAQLHEHHHIFCAAVHRWPSPHLQVSEEAGLPGHIHASTCNPGYSIYPANCVRPSCSPPSDEAFSWKIRRLRHIKRQSRVVDTSQWPLSLCRSYVVPSAICTTPQLHASRASAASTLLCICTVAAQSALVRALLQAITIQQAPPEAGTTFCTPVHPLHHLYA